MRDTGFKDKQGVEISEGDIVEMDWAEPVFTNDGDIDFKHSTRLFIVKYSKYYPKFIVEEYHGDDLEFNELGLIPRDVKIVKKNTLI